MSTNVTGFDPPPFTFPRRPSADHIHRPLAADACALNKAATCLANAKRHEPHFVNNAAVQAVRPPPTALALEPSTLLNAKHGIAVNSDAATGVVTVTPQTPKDGSSGKHGILTTFSLSNEAKTSTPRATHAGRHAKQTASESGSASSSHVRTTRHALCTN